MKITLTKQESETYFHNALCNGLNEMRYYDLELTFEDADYEKAKKSLQAKKPKDGICYEDVLMEILRVGGKLTLKDLEDDEEDEEVSENTKSITLKDVHERVAKTPMNHLMDMVNETDDATTADVIIQTVFYEDVIFG